MDFYLTTQLNVRMVSVEKGTFYIQNVVGGWGEGNYMHTNIGMYVNP